MTRTTVFLAAALALSACALPAAAQSQLTIGYDDLDIARPAGAEALLSRIKIAARTVCGSADLRDITRSRMVTACRKDAVDGAVRAVHSPLVARLNGQPQLFVDDARFNVAAAQ